MPVTAKLSRKFYEKLGDDIANELVEWFNAVDATYRSEFRETNELSFARFDAKLDQRITALDAKLDQRITALDAKLDQRVAELRAEMQVGFARVDAKLEESIRRLETRLVRWVLGVWIAQAATTVGLVLGVVKLLH